MLDINPLQHCPAKHPDANGKPLHLESQVENIQDQEMLCSSIIVVSLVKIILMKVAYHVRFANRQWWVRKTIAWLVVSIFFIFIGLVGPLIFSQWTNHQTLVFANGWLVH